MAQNITLQGASYTDVPWVDLPKTGGGTARFVDVSEMDDYVVAHGTSALGNAHWTWRVWNSGVAECWLKTGTTTVNAWSLWANNIYYSTSALGGISFPTNFFADVPDRATVEFIATANDAWVGYTTAPTASKSPEIYLLRPNQTSCTGYLQYYACGTVSSSWTG